MRIAVYNEKGGSGKTTLAVAVSVALELPMLDLDPQGTATHWLGQRDVALPKAKKSDASWLADCPPGISPAIASTLSACSLVLIPVRASFADLVTLPATIKFLRASTNAKLGFVCSDIDRRTNDEAMLRTSLVAHGSPVIGVFAHRASYRRAGIEGKLASEVDPAAVTELDELITNIKELLK
jgi:cellulose biosynthesis protein BcsQ